MGPRFWGRTKVVKGSVTKIGGLCKMSEVDSSVLGITPLLYLHYALLITGHILLPKLGSTHTPL